MSSRIPQKGDQDMAEWLGGSGSPAAAGQQTVSNTKPHYLRKWFNGRYFAQKTLCGGRRKRGSPGAAWTAGRKNREMEKNWHTEFCANENVELVQLIDYK